MDTEATASIGAVRGILWDNDGILVDTEPLYFAACREALSRAGIELSRQQFVDISLRRGASVFELALERGLDARAAESLRVRRDEIYSASLSAGVEPRPGVIRLLNHLRGRVRMGIVTSSLREHFDAIHSRSGLPSRFDFVLVREDYGESKPAPEPYLEAIRRMGMPPESLIAIEDTERGLAAARAAGLRCLVLPNSLNRQRPFEGATARVNSVKELGEAIQRLLV
jgi:HAD superfamily hydrolase (TIGR01509 family)